MLIDHGSLHDSYLANGSLRPWKVVVGNAKQGLREYTATIRNCAAANPLLVDGT